MLSAIPPIESAYDPGSQLFSFVRSARVAAPCDPAPVAPVTVAL